MYIHQLDGLCIVSVRNYDKTLDFKHVYSDYLTTLWLNETAYLSKKQYNPILYTTLGIWSRYNAQSA